MVKKRIWLVLTLAIVLSAAVLALAACGGAGGGRAGGTLNVFISEPAYIDPNLVVESEGGQVDYALFEGLTKFNQKTLALEPGVAESWKSNADATVWTFNLKHGTKFHNGREVVAGDFKYSWERLCNPKNESQYSGLLNMIKGYDEFVAANTPPAAASTTAGETTTTAAVTATTAAPAVTEISGIKVVDNYTLEVTMTKPFAEFPLVVGVIDTAPVPKEELDTEAKAKAFALMPIGNGPFKMAEPWKSGQYIKVVRFEDYSGTKPKIDGVNFKIYADAQTAWVDFQAGTLDWTVIPPGQYKSSVTQYGLADDGLTSNPGKQVENGAEPSAYFLTMNNNDDLMKNADLRRAISLAINRQAICDVVWEGTRKPATSCVPASIPGYEANAWQYCRYDVEAAKAMLATAGYPGGAGLPTIKLSFNSGALHEQVMQLVQADLKAIGINTEFDTSDAPTFYGKLSDGKFQIARCGFGVDYPSIDDYMTPVFGADSGSNYDKFKDAAIQQEMADARAILDDDKRLAAWKKIVKEIGDICPDVPIAVYAHERVTSSRVHNLTCSPLLLLDLTDCWISQ